MLFLSLQELWSLFYHPLQNSSSDIVPNILFMFPRGKKTKSVWNNMRVGKLWQNCNFCVKLWTIPDRSHILWWMSLRISKHNEAYNDYIINSGKADNRVQIKLSLRSIYDGMLGHAGWHILWERLLTCPLLAFLSDIPLISSMMSPGSANISTWAWLPWSRSSTKTRPSRYL